MKNKGFALVEIIVCLVLITLIGTISVISINSSNKKKKEEVKLISTVTNAANVYYSMNNDLKQKLKDNYGYLVVSIEDLKNNGYLDKNYIVPNSDDKDYSKMVIVERDISDDYRLLSNDNLGYVDYIYPYIENDPFIIKLDDLIIEDFEKNNLECSSGLEDGKLSYLDKDYLVQKVDNSKYECEYYNYDKDNLTIGSKISKNELINGNIYKIKYNIKNTNIEGYRTLTINNIPDIHLYVKYNNEKKEYSNETHYFNSNIDLLVEDKNNNTHNKAYIKFSENLQYDSDTNTNSITLNSPNIGTYQNYDGTISYKICGYLNEEDCRDYSFPYDVVIDRENPYIERIDYNKKQIEINDKGSGIKSYKIDNEEDEISKEPNNKVDITISNKENFTLTMVDNAGNEVTEEVSLKNPININVTENNDISTFNVIVESGMPNVKINSVQVQYSFDKEFLEDMSEYVKKDIKSSEMKETMQTICSTKVSESHSRRYYCNNFTNKFLYEKDYSKRQENINQDSYNDDKTKFNQTFDMKTALNNCGSSKFCKRYISFEFDILDGLEINYHIKVNYDNNGKEETQEKEYLIKLNILKKYNIGDDYGFRGRHFHVEGINNNGDLLFYETISDDGRTIYEFSLFNNKENQIKNITNLNEYSRWERYWDSNVSVISYDENEIRLYSCTTNRHGIKRFWYDGEYYIYTYNIQKDSLFNKRTSTKREKTCESYKSSESNKKNNFIRFKDDSDYEFLNWLINLSQGRYGWDYSNSENFSKFYLYNDFDVVIPSDDKKSKNIIIRERYQDSDQDRNYYYYLLNYKSSVSISN